MSATCSAVQHSKLQYSLKYSTVYSTVEYVPVQYVMSGASFGTPFRVSSKASQLSLKQRRKKRRKRKNRNRKNERQIGLTWHDDLLEVLYAEMNAVKGRCTSKVTRNKDEREALGIHVKIR
jgi:hypothetical protein